MTLLELLHLMGKHRKLAIALPLLCTITTAFVAWFVLPDAYTANVSMYVLTRSNTNAESLTNADLTASQMLTNDVVQLIKSDRVVNDTASNLHMKNLNSYEIKVTSATTTRVIALSVTGSSAQSVAIIANGLAKTTDSVAKEVMEVKSVNVIDEASAPLEPSGPPRALYTAVALVAGILLAAIVIVLKDMLNTRVRSPEEAEKLLEIPIIGRIPKIND